MDRDEAIKLLSGGEDGVAEWNQRRGDGEEITSLDSADLAGALLDNVNLRGASLSNANFRGASLRGVNLDNAYLGGADLRRANLKDANLKDANLKDANLHGADLDGADLDGANLIRADLGYASLVDANLYGANLAGADLTRAKLAGAKVIDAKLLGTNLYCADLTRVKLVRSNIMDANLTHATLVDADLADANLAGANLMGANLSNANVERLDAMLTAFNRVDLSTTKGLEEVVHRGPSSVGIDTIYASKGKIPEVFLSGCGVPESFITYISSLVGNAIDFYSCFISYSHQDEEFSKRLHSRMREDKLRVWYAPEDMKSGRKIHEQIDSAIRLHDKLLVVLSEHSMQSEWVEHEIRRARQREVKEGKRVLFPIRMVPMEAIETWTAFDAKTRKDMADEICEYFIPDFTNWKDHDSFEKSYQRLMDDFKPSPEDGSEPSRTG